MLSEDEKDARIKCLEEQVELLNDLIEEQRKAKEG